MKPPPWVSLCRPKLRWIANSAGSRAASLAPLCIGRPGGDRTHCGSRAPHRRPPDLPRALPDYKFRPSIQVTYAAIADYYRDRLVPELKAKGQRPPPLTDVTEQIQEVLVEQGVNARTAAWFDETKPRLKIEIEPMDASVAQQVAVNEPRARRKWKRWVFGLALPILALPVTLLLIFPSGALDNDIRHTIVEQTENNVRQR